MRNYFTFGGLDSRDYGIYISGSGVYNAPERQYNMIEIPGRSGDLIGLERRIANIELKYPAFIYDRFKQNISKMKTAFMGLSGYQILKDTYYPEEYRKAVYVGGTEVDAYHMNNAGQFELTFSCKPQRYLVSGNNQVDVTTSLSIINPTDMPASPLIRVYGYGTLGINGDTVTIAQHATYTDIDCEMMECYSGTTSENSYVSFSTNDFPVLIPGANVFTKTSNITQILITPRWWTV